MTQHLANLRNEWPEQWREELARQQKFEQASFNRDKEKLLRREMARLRLKLKLGRVCEHE